MYYYDVAEEIDDVTAEGYAMNKPLFAVNPRIDEITPAGLPYRCSQCGHYISAGKCKPYEHSCMCSVPRNKR